MVVWTILMKMKIVVFSIGEQAYALETKWIDTVENMESFTRVPKASKQIMGLYSSRGQVVTIVDGGKLLSNNVGNDNLKKLVVVDLKGEKVALAVAEIKSVREVEEDVIEHLDGSEERVVIKIEGNVIFLIQKNHLEQMLLQIFAIIE